MTKIIKESYYSITNEINCTKFQSTSEYWLSEKKIQIGKKALSAKCRNSQNFNNNDNFNKHCNLKDINKITIDKKMKNESQLPPSYNVCMPKARKKKLQKHFVVIIFLTILTTQLTWGHAIFTKNEKHKTRPDLLCNEGDEHECVCSRSLGDLDEKYLTCDSFLEVKRISVICIKMRHVNLNARLYTSESYQQYFRRRIANILSKYCEQQTNECPGTIVALRKQLKNNQRKLLEQQFNAENANNFENSILLEEDEEEPAFTKENVVILKVVFDKHNRTNVYFVVTKSTNVGSLNSLITMDPNKIKSIMSAQIAPLSRVLGGIRIEQLRVVELRKARSPYTNKSLIITVTVIGILFTTCCFIAFLKLIRDSKKRAKHEIRKSSFDQKNNNTQNYGTCTKKFLLKNNRSHNSEKLTSLNSSIRSNKQNSTIVSLKAPYISIDTDKIVEEENNESKRRNLRNLFRCDPSQLPRESGVNHNYSVKKNTKNYVTHNKVFATNSKNNEKVLYFDSKRQKQPQSQFREENGKKSNHNQQTVILVSTINETPAETIHDKKLLDFYPPLNLGTLEAPCKLNPYNRPLSRRGSRESIPEQGAEEYETSREDTPLPLGDHFEKGPIKQLYTDNLVDGQVNAQNLFLSSSDSEDEERKIYHPLNHYPLNDEKNKHLKKKNLLNNTISIQKNSAQNENGNALLYIANFAASSDSEEESENNIEESKMLDRHQYKRLQESPLHLATTSTVEQLTT